MQIASPTFTAEIRTPIEYPDSYDPDWRWSLAHNLAGMEDHEQCHKKLLELDDEYITMAVATIKTHLADEPLFYDILTMMCSNRQHFEDPRVLVERARRIREDAVEGRSSTAHYLESLLLCFDADMAEICKRLPLDESLILYYEKLFYNCRTDYSWKATKVSLRRHFALEGAVKLPLNANDQEYWRYTGAIHGCQLLYNEWGWCIEDGKVAIAAIAKSLQQVTLNNARRISEAGETPRQAQAAMIDVVGRLLEAHSAGELDSKQQELITMLSTLAPTMRATADEDFDAITPEFEKSLKALQESSKNHGEDGVIDATDLMRRQLGGSFNI